MNLPLKKYNSYVNDRLNGLDSLRGLAALFILLGHGSAWFTTNIFLREIDFSQYGMPLFFTLSGFVLYYAFSKNQDQNLFLQKRLTRIYFPFLLFNLIFYSIDGVFEWTTKDTVGFLKSIFHNLTLTTSWVFATVENGNLVLDTGWGLGWSLSTEFFFYLFLPFIFYKITKIDEIKTCIYILILITLLLILVNSIRPQLSNFIENGNINHEKFIRWFYYYSPYVRIFEFITGCIYCKIHILLKENISIVKLYATALVILFITLFIKYIFLFLPELKDMSLTIKLNYLYSNIFGILILIIINDKNNEIIKIFYTKGALIIGGCSLSIYLLHAFIGRVYIFSKVSGDSNWVTCLQLIQLISFILVTLATSIILRPALEVRLRNLSNRIIKYIVVKGKFIFQRPFSLFSIFIIANLIYAKF